MADPRHILGSLAEDAVATWLRSWGWTLLARRYRSAAGSEVDLVLLDPTGTLVGVEVRARSSHRAGAPEETVDARRASRIAHSLVAFGVESRLPHTRLRVDLVAVEPSAGSGGHRVLLRRIADIAG